MKIEVDIQTENDLFENTSKLDLSKSENFRNIERKQKRISILLSVFCVAMFNNIDTTNWDENAYIFAAPDAKMKTRKEVNMELDARSSNLMHELVTNSGIKNMDLEKKYNLSRRQIEYSLNKINDWLKTNSLPEIERTKTGLFLVDKILVTALLGEKEKKATKTYILSETERTHLIILMLLSRSEELSLFHFTYALSVSKNTILSDLKNAQTLLADFELSIKYSRQQGYWIEGTEFNKRQALMNAVYKSLELYNGENLMLKLADISKDEISELRKRIGNIESKLNLKFTDEKIESMPYILYLILRRIKLGKIIDSFIIHYEEISDTKEYKVAEELLLDLDPIPTEERLFIALHLLSTNVSSTECLTSDSLPKLKEVLDKLLSLFEKHACVALQEKEQLQDIILLHLKPAYYRIKYNLSLTNPLQETISTEFKELHHIVKKSIAPLRDLIGCEIPESETTYLTMLIGGWLTRQGDSIQQKIKALVVCPKGVCVSKLLHSALRELFPEFIFLDSLSVREFQNYTFDYDIVFSSVYLQTNKKLFIVKSFLEKEDKYRLRKQVMLELHGYVPSEFNLERIIEIVEKHADIRKKDYLVKELREYFIQDTQSKGIQQLEAPIPNLCDLIVPETILLKESAQSLEDAIRMGAKPLLDRGAITFNYVEAMVKFYENEDPYIMIEPRLAIPHADPECGVNEVSMSLLCLEKPVRYASNYFVHVFVVIAARDKQQHFRALMQLMKLAGSKDEVTAVINSQSAKEIHQIIRKYSKE